MAKLVFISVWLQSSCSFYNTEALGGVAPTLWTSGESFSQPLLRLTAYMRFLDTGVPSPPGRQDFSSPAHLSHHSFSDSPQDWLSLVFWKRIQCPEMQFWPTLWWPTLFYLLSAILSDTVLTKSLISSCTWQRFLLAAWSLCLLSFPLPSHTPHWFQRCGSKTEI